MTDLFGNQGIDAYGDAIAARNAGMAQVEKNAGDEFREKARAFVLRYLEMHGPTPSEMLTDAAKVHGIKAHNDKAMGPVLMSLARAGKIRKAGTCKRRKGHDSGLAYIWELSR